MSHTFARSRYGLLVAVFAALALLSRPVHAEAAPKRAEVRIELRGASTPQVLAAMQPGGETDLDAVVGSLDADIDPTRCSAHLATAPDGTSHAVTVGGCADTSVSATVSVGIGTAAPAANATVSYDGQTGTSGQASLSCFGLDDLIIIVIIIIVITSDDEE